ncbi:MAG TPA: hypothetical protein VJP80_02920 [Candidatus Saccharimonadales bacterium]|nr:hypothetical protein [Candidatus Saccharimonadales bacterium]
MRHMPVWGPALYQPENLQRYARLTGETWGALLRRKRAQIIGLFVLSVFGACLLIAIAGCMFYIAIFVLHTRERYALAVVALWMLALAAGPGSSSLRLLYYLFVDTRDIATVLESQIDHGRQRNIW